MDQDIQNTIKEYNFCKTFNIPPFPSLNETPAKTIDEFLLIENEIATSKDNGDK